TGDYRISVGFPFSYGSTARTYPVLYVLDADMDFCTVLEISRVRGVFGEIGEIVVVGIGYPDGSDYGAGAERRTYDFTTAEWDRSAPIWSELEAMYATLGRRVRLGGLVGLLDFITDELQPLMNERYRVDPGDQAIFGWSAGGTFVLNALFRK